jgi:hypothetical protein
MKPAWLHFEILLERLFSHIRGTIESLRTWATRILGGQHGLLDEPTPIAGFPPCSSPTLDWRTAHLRGFSAWHQAALG